MSSSKTVVVTQLRLTHYRVAFFEALRRLLAARGVNLILVYGQPDPREIGKLDEGMIDWAVHVKNYYWRVNNKFLAWQPFPAELKNADLIVVTQENRILSNYFHLLRRVVVRSRVAFWGHGANLQGQNRKGLKERFKQWTTNRVDWWFAYTQMSADLVGASGFPIGRITVLNNSVDTSDLQRQRQTVTPEETQALRKSLGFGTGPVGAFLGSLYAYKRLDFLFAAADGIRQGVPDFNLLIVGDGNERDKVNAWCADRPWARWVGSRFGREKAAYISVAQVMLNPGLVGLGILDSFVCEVPMLTTTCGIHSPEIAYLENGINGVITSDDLEVYVSTCVHLLHDAQRLEALRTGCSSSAKKYTVENMARRFADGVVHAIAG